MIDGISYSFLSNVLSMYSIETRVFSAIHKTVCIFVLLIIEKIFKNMTFRCFVHTEILLYLSFKLLNLHILHLRLSENLIDLVSEFSVWCLGIFIKLTRKSRDDEFAIAKMMTFQKKKCLNCSLRRGRHVCKKILLWDCL